MKVITIQSGDLKITGRVYPNGKCNHEHAKPIYERLFKDYNDKKETNYNNFFWGFSELLQDKLVDCAKRASEMIGLLHISDKNTEKLFLLDVPDEICLETDFYNFSDEIYAYEFPEELSSHWENIYSNRKSEKQVIFPYIDDSMILSVFDLKDILLI